MLFSHHSTFLVAWIVLSFFSASAFGGSLNPFEDDPEPTPPPKPSPAPGPKTYVCPQDHGATYYSGGVTFQLKCNQGTTAARLRDSQAESQTACADLCAKDPLCQSCDWSAATKNCGQFKEYIPTIEMTGVNTWFPTEKRPGPPPDPNSPNCPQSNNTTYTTSDGTFYRLFCSVHTIAESYPAEKIRKTQAVSYAACMEQCSAEPGCLSIDYVARPGGDHTVNDCVLFRSGGGDTPTSSCAKKTNDMAYAIDPPEEDAPDTAAVACSTECPYANGQTFDSSSGERFHIDCGRRHGTKVLAKTTQPSFKDCLDACGALVACHSVDYQVSKKLCYFGQHHGEPEHVSPGWASAHSLGCSGAYEKRSCCTDPKPPAASVKGEL
ncbi:hypothetical protein E8E11_009055 [Didymella keratinophila]|nr:hypothetical protein E8E11_009055 [Didymella keratinophila]